MHLSRILIPVNDTRSGSFHHDLAPPAEALPGLTVANELAQLLNPGEDRHYVVRTQLLRERNRIDAAPRAALNLVDGR